MNTNGNTSLRLSDARQSTPPATGAAGEWVTRVAEAMREAITPGDVAEIMKGLVARAKAGDAKAIRDVLAFVGRAEQQSQPPRASLSIGVRSAAPAAPAPRVVQALPADPAAVRRDCAVVLGRSGPMPAAELAAAAGYEPVEVEGALAEFGPGRGVLPQFEADGHGRWKLTTTGRKELLGG